MHFEHINLLLITQTITFDAQIAQEPAGLLVARTGAAPVGLASPTFARTTTSERNVSFGKWLLPERPSQKATMACPSSVTNDVLLVLLVCSFSFIIVPPLLPLPSELRATLNGAAPPHEAAADALLLPQGGNCGLVDHIDYSDVSPKQD